MHLHRKMWNSTRLLVLKRFAKQFGKKGNLMECQEEIDQELRHFRWLTWAWFVEFWLFAREFNATVYAETANETCSQYKYSRPSIQHSLNNTTVWGAMYFHSKPAKYFMGSNSCNLWILLRWRRSQWAVSNINR